MKILLTAFDPFGGETVNPAQEALKQIQAPAPDMELIKLVVPVLPSPGAEVTVRVPW